MYSIIIGHFIAGLIAAIVVRYSREALYTEGFLDNLKWRGSVLQLLTLGFYVLFGYFTFLIVFSVSIYWWFKKNGDKTIKEIRYETRK
jgi:Na+-driven multidrug efflux pump